MLKLSKIVFVSVLSVVIAIGISACGGTATVTNTVKPADNSKPSDNTKPADNSKPADKPATTAEKIGVPECDEYIEKYEACIFEKVPAAQQGVFKTSFETQRKAWKDAAATPQGKAALATGCKAALDSAKTSMASFGCKW